jgi:hypothetical protein
MLSSPFLLGFLASWLPGFFSSSRPLRFRDTAIDTILVDRARGEKRFVMTNLSKATPPFAVQGR